METTLIIDSWNRGCEVDDASYEKLVLQYLPEFYKDFASDLILNFDDEFKRPGADAASLEKFLRDSPSFEHMERCNIKPRDELWMEVIKPQLTTKGSPLVIVAGAAHMVGEYGLLNMLCQAGYCGAKRIFKLE